MRVWNINYSIKVRKLDSVRYYRRGKYLFVYFIGSDEYRFKFGLFF